MSAMWNWQDRERGLAFGAAEVAGLMLSEVEFVEYGSSSLGLKCHLSQIIKSETFCFYVLIGLGSAVCNKSILISSCEEITFMCENHTPLARM